MEAKELKNKLGEYAKKTGIKLNPDEKVVDNIIKGLLMKQQKFGEIYCPCRVVSGDKKKDKEIICPCAFHREEIKLQGYCLCRLFVK